MENFSFSTPSKKRRSAKEAESQPSRAGQADAYEEKARKDVGVFGKRMVRRSYYKIEKIPREKGGPPEGNPEWSAEKADGPVRRIVEELFRSRPNSSREVHKGSQGWGRSTKVGISPRHGGEIHARNSAVVRDACAREPLRRDTRPSRRCTQGGRANASRNLMRYPTVDDSGPPSPGATVRVFRRKIVQMGMFFAKTKNASTSERPRPYIRRWVVSY